MPSISITELSQLRPLVVDLFQSALRAKPDAFDMYFAHIEKSTKHPLLSIEAWGWLVEARRQNKIVSEARSD